MKIEDFLLNFPILELPSIRPKGKDLYQHIREVLSEYKDTLNAVDNFEIDGMHETAYFDKGFISYIDLVRSVSNNIIKAIISITERLAAGCKEEAFKILKVELDERLSTDTAISLEILRSNTNLYRFRIPTKNPVSHPRDIFHIPTSMPHLIKSYRFSANVVPCLYLSSSPYLCWHELDKKQLDTCHVAKFNSTFDRRDNYKDGIWLLNLVDTLPILRSEAKKEKHHWNNLIKYLSLWPLIFVTSIKVDNQNSPMEYEIPQMIIRYFVERNKKYESKIYGVKYSSTKLAHDNQAIYNIAIPTEEGLTSPYSPYLTGHIKLTQPYSCRFILNSQKIDSKADESEKFRTIEEYLNRCELFQIDQDGSIK